MLKFIGRIVFMLAILPHAAGAQSLTDSTSKDKPAQSQPHRKDSLWNGVIFGAAVGAMLGSFSSLAVTDCSECAGFNVPLTFGVIGAGVGIGIGAGLDALHSKRGASLQRHPRVRLSPLVAKEKQGLMAWVRF
jgi:hypothetical protein